MASIEVHKLNELQSIQLSSVAIGESQILVIINIISEPYG